MLWFFVRKIIVTDKNCCDVFICLQDQNDRNAIIKSCAPKTKIHAKKVQNMSKRGIAGFITIPLYCTFHKHANSKVEKRFSLPSIIIMITRKEPWNTETHKTYQNAPITTRSQTMAFWTHLSKVLSPKMIDSRVRCECQLAFELQSLRVFKKCSNTYDYNWG